MDHDESQVQIEQQDEPVLRPGAAEVAEVGPGAGVEAGPGPEAEAGPGAGVEAGPGPEAEAGPGADAKAGPGPEPGTEPEPEAEPRPGAGAEAGPEPEAGVEPADGVTGVRTASSGRRAGFAAGRAVIVLVVAAIGYQAVIPSVHVVRTRLARLVVTHPGVAAFNRLTPQSGEQDDTSTGLTAVTNAAKKTPNETGLYSIAWSPSQSSGVGILAYLLPDATQASTTLTELRSQQLAAGSYASDGLTRRTTFTVNGVPNSFGSFYGPTARAPKGTPDLAVTAFTYGRVTVVSEVVTTTGAQSGSLVVAQNQYSHLRGVVPGFSLTETYRPPLATGLWIGGAVLLALIAAFSPMGWRWRTARRRRRMEEEAARRVVVRGQVIYKHRR